jgi:hypothetical protein
MPFVNAKRGEPMNDLRGPKTAQRGRETSAEAEREADLAMVIPRRRHDRWGRIAAVAVLAAGMAWATGRVASKRVENDGLETSSRYQAPPPEYPKPTRTADNNNALSRMRFVADLDGKVVAYAKEVNGFVSNGRFRIDLPLKRVADILRISPDSIVNPRAPDEIDPDAELFKAQAGTLSESGKERSRKFRTDQLREGKLPDAAVGEMVITNFSFTLNRLTHPADEEKAVLAAIIHAAAGTMPMPGDKIRAVGVDRGDLEPGFIAVAPGMLPPEAPQSASQSAVPRP